MSATDAATVAAVLAEHRAVVSGDDDGWHVVCSCGHNKLGDDPQPHLAAALLAAPPIAQALAAVEVVARVEALAGEWEQKWLAGRGYLNDPVTRMTRLDKAAEQIRVALRPGSPS